MTRYERRMKKAQEVVPVGHTCYSLTGNTTMRTHIIGADGLPQTVEPYGVPELKPCPYWKRRGDWRDQADGYCRLLKRGDSSPPELATMLLWDQVKECDVNPAPEEPGEI